MRFFDASHPHATLASDLVRNFPGEYARVTSSSRDGRIVVVTVSGDREPSRYYLLDTASGDLTLFGRSRPWLDSDRLSQVVPVQFPARDGSVLHGYLTLPRFPHGSAAPLVIMPHGGPFGARDGWFYDGEVQLLAARGYAVL